MERDNTIYVGDGQQLSNQKDWSLEEDIYE